MRLIDADALKEKASDTDYMPTWKWVSLSDIEALPTIEPKHGKWIADKYTRKCSECGSTYWMREGNAWNYCPNCGAKVEEKK